MLAVVPLLAAITYDPIVKFHLGPLSISPHGLGIAVGFLAGAWLIRPDTRARGVSDNQLEAMLTRAAIGAVIGARLAYVINHPSEYSNPLDALAIWKGGISLLGGIFGAVIAAYPLMRKYRIAVPSIMDAAAPGLALGIVIGRIGDLIVGDHLGKSTSFFLGFKCTGAETASPCVAPIGQAVHMPALYDLMSVSVLLVVLLLIRHRGLPTGLLILLFAGWYSVGRIIEDFFRIDVTHGTGLTGSQWTSVATLVVSAVLAARVLRSARRSRSRMADEEDPAAIPQP